MLSARSMISGYSASRFFSLSFFESSSPAMGRDGPRITAATETGLGQRPASGFIHPGHMQKRGDAHRTSLAMASAARADASWRKASCSSRLRLPPLFLRAALTLGSIAAYTRSIKRLITEAVTATRSTLPPDQRIVTLIDGVDHQLAKAGDGKNLPQ